MTTEKKNSGAEWFVEAIEDFELKISRQYDINERWR